MVRLVTVAVIFLGAVFALFSLKPVQLGGLTITDAPTAVINKLQTEFDGKYRYYNKGELREDIYVHEYVSGDGQAGYQIFQEEMRPDGLYRRSFGEGPEAETRTFDWKLVEAVATST